MYARAHGHGYTRAQLQTQSIPSITNNFLTWFSSLTNILHPAPTHPEPSHLQQTANCWHCWTHKSHLNMVIGLHLDAFNLSSNGRAVNDKQWLCSNGGLYLLLAFLRSLNLTCSSCFCQWHQLNTAHNAGHILAFFWILSVCIQSFPGAALGEVWKCDIVP